MKEYFTERRVTKQVCEYWNSIKGDHKYPKKSDISRGDILEFLPYCVIVDILVENGNVAYNISYVGENIKKFHDEGVFSETFVPFISPNVDTCEEYFDEVYETGEPIVDSSEAMSISQEEIKFRQCLLPLSDNGSDVTGILGVLSCKLQKQE